MSLLKKIINIFYSVNEDNPRLLIGTPIPGKFKPQLERTLWTFVNFALERKVFHEPTIGKIKPLDLNLFAYKTDLKERKETYSVSYGHINTLKDDFEITVDIKTKQNILILFSVYVSKINGEKTDLIFRFDNDREPDLLKVNLQEFISHIVYVLFN